MTKVTSTDGNPTFWQRVAKNVARTELIKMEALSEDAADFLERLVRAGYNIFVSGANRIIGLSQMTFRKQRVQTT